jgi:hypothetical protein
MTAIPQYASSTDPAVIAVVERNRVARREFTEAADAFARKHAPTGNGRFFMSDGWGSEWYLVGIYSIDEPAAGRWKKGRGAGCWVPFKNNPLFQEMSQIRRRRELVPGLASTYAGEYNRDGSQAIYFPSVFLHDGFAYMGMPGVPVSDQEESGFGSTEFDTALWTEIYPSQWHAAKEAVEAQRKIEASR